jgi:hypothetical protein
MKPIIALCLLALSSIAPASELDLGARVRPLPEENRFALKDYFVWCGAPVKGPDGRYHLFYSRWPVKVGFAPGWAIHSEIAYAVADAPAGPYTMSMSPCPREGRIRRLAGSTGMVT